MPISVALSPHFETFIRDQVESGRCNDVSEVVCAGVRLLEDTEPPQTWPAAQHLLLTHFEQ
jgi:antitoxin ParD1/3/4